jgi:hypothetical protein
MANRRRIKKKIRRAALRYGIDPDVFEAQIGQESGFQQGLTSSAGAKDIAQFIPSTAKQYGVTLGDGKVDDDIDGAARYMRDNLKRTGGNYKQALSIYNSGRPDGYLSIAETKNYVQTILGNSGGAQKTAPRSVPKSAAPSYTTETVPGVDRSADRRALRINYLSERGKPGALLNLGLSLRDAQDTPDSQVRVETPGQAQSKGGVHGTGVALATAAKQEADLINNAKVRYQWGGGHAGKQKRGSKVTPLDCSGAVSRVLGIDPRVSGEFAKWGKPGKGRVTVYSNSKHVLMEIDGHFFGTSASNPGGGAGWIPRGQVSKQYLKGFVARHA